MIAMPFRLKGEWDFMAMREWAREHAANNALTLILMAAGFVVTWAVIAIATLWAVHHG